MLGDKDHPVQRIGIRQIADPMPHNARNALARCACLQRNGTVRLCPGLVGGLSGTFRRLSLHLFEGPPFEYAINVLRVSLEVNCPSGCR